MEKIRFTKTALAGLAIPPDSRVTYFDKHTPKLALRVSPSGAKIFYVVKRIDAKIVWIRLGSFPDISVEQAQRLAAKTIGNIAGGENPAENKRIEKAKQSLGDAFERYMSMHAAPREIKAADDFRALWERCVGRMPERPTKKHGRPRTKHPAGVDWSGKKIDSISNSDVRKLHAAIGETHSTMANRVLEILSTVFNRAIEWGAACPNPVLGIRPFKENKRDRFIQSDELPKFFEALRNDTSVDFQHFVLLALLTGARRNNVLAMKWEEISLDRASWRIPITKNGEPVIVPLVDEAIAILRARGVKPNGYVFPANSATGHITPPKKRWQALRERAGVSDLRVHDLRRSLGSWQAITGASLAIIGKSLGHKSADATMIYARLSMDPVRASVNTATSAMLEAGGVKKAAKVTRLKKS
jgi:integrase